MKFKAENIQLGLATVAAILLLHFFSGSSLKTSELPFMPPPENPQFFTFGYNENAADSLWVRLIQDMDYCDATLGSGAKAAAERTDADNERLKAHEHCHSHLGWSYQMLNAITILSPYFRMPYNHGATILSVTVGDVEGAKRIFDRGIVNFPKDWSLEYRAAYHYLYEVKDDKKAAELLTLAGKNGAPEWVFSLAARLYSKEGKAELARSVLQSALDEDPDSKYADSLKHRLRQLNNIIAGRPEDFGEK